MSKRDYIWVAIRIFGLYLIVHAVMVVHGIVFASILAHSAWAGSSADTSDPFRGTYSMLQRNAVSQLAGSLAQFVLFTVIGFYLLRGGGWLFRIVCPPDQEKSAIQP